MLIPQEREFDACDLQGAHNFVSKMMQNQEACGTVAPKVHCIEEMPEPEVLFPDQ